MTMSQGAWMMIHEAHGTLSGGADDLESAAERIRAINQQLIAIYLPRWLDSARAGGRAGKRNMV
jgi:ATP-dependent protease ClpP protease subunit